MMIGSVPVPGSVTARLYALATHTIRAVQLGQEPICPKMVLILIGSPTKYVCFGLTVWDPCYGHDAM